MVRILKNMRSRLVNDGVTAEGSAPSYFLEGLLYNVPNDKFGTSYGDTFVAAMNWILEADRKKFVCANGNTIWLATLQPSAGLAQTAMVLSAPPWTYGTTGLNVWGCARAARDYAVQL